MGNEKVKLSLFADIIIYIENYNDSIKKKENKTTRNNKKSKIAGNNINI